MMTHLISHSSDPVKHDHGNDFQITIPIAGSPTLELNNKTNALNQNIRMITSPGEEHFHYTGDTDSRILLININRDFLNKVVSSNLNKDLLDIDFRKYGEGSSEKLVKIAEELSRINLFSDIDLARVDELEWELAETLLNLQDGSHTEDWRREVTLNHHPLIKKVVNYIEENYQEEISLEKLARESNLSKYYFIRAFKEAMGCTPSQYVTQIRLVRAMDLLTKTKLDITAICFEVGFGSLQTFERVFKKRYGLTISDFRKQIMY